MNDSQSCGYSNGWWTNWSGWSGCSSCNQTRSRSCVGQACGGAGCSGANGDNQHCGDQNGGWSGWSLDSCATSCGQTVTRSCTNPSPACNGAGCSGSNSNYCGSNDEGAPAQVFINSPAGDAANPTLITANVNTVPLSWQQVPALTDLYEVQVFNSTGAVVWQTTLNALSTTTGALAWGVGSANIYHWQVRAVNNTCAAGFGVNTIYYGPWSTMGYFRIDKSPTFSTLIIKNQSGTVVAPEIGNRNQICQVDGSEDQIFPNRVVTFEASVGDPTGMSEVVSVVLGWHGKTYAMTFPTVGVSGTATTTITFGAGDNDGGVWPTTVTITNLYGTSNSGLPATNRAFKVWDCKVPLSGSMYDASTQPLGAVCPAGTGFSMLVPTTTNFTTVGITEFPTANTWTESVPQVAPGPGGNTYSAATSLYWGRTYSIQPNADTKISSLVTRWIDTGSNVGVTSCGVQNALTGMVVNPYSASPSLKVDFAGIRDQDPWFQVAGGGIMSRSQVSMMVPITCYLKNDPSICKWAMSIDSTIIGAGSTNSGLVASPQIYNSSGCTLGSQCVAGSPNNWSYANNVVNDSLGYGSLYNDYYATTGQGIAIGSGTSMSQVIALSGGTGVVFVNGQVDVDVNNTVSSGKFFMLVSSGSINFMTSVTRSEGVFVADGGIVASGLVNYSLGVNQLKINGILFASNNSNIRFGRGYVDHTDNNLYPGVMVNYRPDFLFSMPSSLSKVITDWAQSK